MKAFGITFSLILLFISSSIYSQSVSEVNELKRKADSTITEMKDSKIYTIVEVMPEYPGGKKAMLNYLATETKYPESAKKDKVRGTVYLTFVVDVIGKVGDVAIIRGVREDLDNEAIRVVESMPDWTPGMQKGKAVKVQYTLPLSFRE